MFVPVCRIIGLLRNHSLGNSKRNEGHESTLRCLRGTQGHINTESLISNGSSPFKSNATFTHFKGTWYVEHGATLSILFPHTRKRLFFYFFLPRCLSAITNASLPSLLVTLSHQEVWVYCLVWGVGQEIVWWRNKNNNVLFGWNMLTWSQCLYFSSALTYWEQKRNSKCLRYLTTKKSFLVKDLSTIPVKGRLLYFSQR